MRKKAVIIVSVIVILCTTAFFLDPVVHQGVETSSSSGTGRPALAPSVYKSLGCLTFGLGDMVVGHGFVPHKGVYLSCTTPPLAPQVSRV
jgi:hypothetical protein